MYLFQIYFIFFCILIKASLFNSIKHIHKKNDHIANCITYNYKKNMSSIERPYFYGYEIFKHDASTIIKQNLLTKFLNGIRINLFF